MITLIKKYDKLSPEDINIILTRIRDYHSIDIAKENYLKFIWALINFWLDQNKKNSLLPEESKTVLKNHIKEMISE